MFWLVSFSFCHYFFKEKYTPVLNISRQERGLKYFVRKTTYLISLDGGLLLLLLLPYGVVLLFIFLQFLLADLLSRKSKTTNDEERKYN